MDNYLVPAPLVEGGLEHFRPDNSMSLGDSTFFRGCNIYHTQSVIRQSVHITAQARNDDRVAGLDFKTAFLKRFEGLPYFAPTYGKKGKLEDRLFSGESVDLAPVLLEAILAVEAAIAASERNFTPIGFAVVEEQINHTHLVWETTSPRLSRRAAEVGFIGVTELLRNQAATSPNGQSEFEISLGALLEIARQKRMSHTSSLMKYVAQQRGLPVTVLARDQMRIGQGRAQRYIISSMTNSTSIVAQKLCQDKRLGHRRLVELGLPVPKQAKVASLDAAREAVEKLGFPVVIKPLKGYGGKGVTSGIRGYDEVETAFLNASRIAPPVLVEEFVPGFLYRLLVIGGKFAGALLCEPPAIIGDGEKTVRELIDDLNADPLRDEIIMTKVDYDDEVETLLKQAGLSLDSVVPKGATCPLRLVANVSLGAVARDCTDLVHEDNRELAERAAKGFYVDVGGVDVITPDISRSYRDVGGRIIEVNTRPGLLMHMWPAHGTSRNFAARVFDQLYPSGQDGLIPIAVVAGDRGTGTTAQILDRLLRGCGKSTGLSLREAAYINGKAIDFATDQRRLTPAKLLSDPGVEILVSASSLRRIAQRGLQMDSCSLAIVLDRNKEGNAEHFHTGISVVERATADVFVVGGGNQFALEHFKNLGKRKLILVGNHITDRLVKEHLGRGGTVIADGWTNYGDRMVLMTGEQEVAHFPLDATWSRLSKGRAQKLRSLTKYAIAAAFGLGIPVADISAALRRSSSH
jgi:cyanophycin synthetase